MQRDIDLEEKFGFTVEQEIANTVIHAIGILFGIIAVPLLIMEAFKYHNISFAMGVVIYGLCFLATFIFSTIYHWLRKEKMKLLFEKFDRISIYFFIAGTYTPLILYYMHNTDGMRLLTGIWSMVIIGFVLEIVCVKRFVVISVLFYLVMGLMFLFVLNEFFATMPHLVISLILAGVGLYIIGVVFFVWQRWKYHHAIWHLFVLFASICHFLAVFQTVP